MLQRLAVLLLLLAWGGQVALADDAPDADAFAKEYLDGVSGTRALELVKELTADEMKGRTTGAAGGEAVENWMLNKMAEFGLHPADAGGTYLEPFAFVSKGKRAKGHNALGAIKGRDADLVHEIILVTARMDGPGLGSDGKPLPGSEASAAGAGLLIHLADVLTGNRLRPKRTIIFCGFGATEAGHAGSRALAARYPFQGDVVAVLDLGNVGQGKPVAVVRGGATFPKTQAHFATALKSVPETTVAFRGHAGPGGDHWAFEERGVPAFAIMTEGKVAGVKVECLEVAAQVAGRMLLKLAMHEGSLANPKRMAEYLVREGPRYALGGHVGGKPMLVDFTTHAGIGLTDDATSLLRMNVDGALWEVVPIPASVKEFTELVSRAKKEHATYADVRSSRDLLAAWRSRKFGILALAKCMGPLEHRLISLEDFAKTGLRFVAPWSAMSEAERTGEIVKRLAAVCKRLRLIPDLGVLKPSLRQLARATLGDAPACALLAPEHLAKGGLASLGPETLILAWGSPGETLEPALAEGAPPMVLLDCLALRGMEMLHAWGAKQPEGWALPGSPQRAKIRAVLGGNLLTWLAKAEKK